MSDMVPARQETQMVPAILSDAEIAQMWRVAKSLAASGMFKDVVQAEQAFGRLIVGRDLGLTAAQSLMGLDVVRGNLMMRGTLLGRFVRQSAEYDYAVTARCKDAGRESATVAIYRRDEDGRFPRDADGRKVPEGEETFTIEDAQRMNLVKGGSAWETLPAVMVVWRALAQAVRFYAPDLLGGIPVYTEADSLKELPQVATGEGDGSEPGWMGVSAPQVKALEAMIESAREKGHAGLSDRATLQMRIAGQTPAFVDKQLRVWGEELAAYTPVPDADVVEPEPEPEPEPAVREADVLDAMAREHELNSLSPEPETGPEDEAQGRLA